MTPLWKEKAHRALSSVRAQTVKPASVHAIHGVSLDQARNQGAEWAQGSGDIGDDGTYHGLLSSVHGSIIPLKC